MSSSLVEFSNDLAGVVERAGQSIVGVLEGGREGVSGTVWRSGIAVTAEHTLRGRSSVTVVLPSGEQTTAEVIGRDPGTDIAALKIQEAVAAGTLGDDAQLRVGEIVLSVARRGTAGVATTHGIVSATSGAWRTWQGARVDRWFRLDLNPFTGFSGGPIVNARAEIVGMATSGPRRSVVMIPTSTVNRVVEQLLKGGRVKRGFLGVGVQAVGFPENTVQELKLGTNRGLLVLNVAQGSSAERAGVLLGDILVTIEGAAVHSVRSLQPVLDPENVGKSVQLEVVRGGKLVKVAVVVGDREEN
ncbi:MAG TPA: trypsin-like peptidase domain-containing protein [Candidatus Koribacter sp.]|jgi:S1-C subfamily serine protease